MKLFDKKYMTLTVPAWAVAIMMIVGTIFTVWLVLTIIVRTPLGSYLPGYMTRDERTHTMESMMRLDSLEHQMRVQQAYLAEMTRIMLARQEADSLQRYDSVASYISDTIIAASAMEKEFAQQYQERERFGVNALADIEQLQGMTFFTPLRGKVERDSVFAKDTVRYVSTNLHIVPENATAVIAPVNCTVVQRLLNFGGKWQMILQAQSDYLMIFTGLDKPLADEGETVRQGTPFAQAANDKTPVGIDIWHAGKQTDPERLMDFKIPEIETTNKKQK